MEIQEHMNGYIEEDGTRFVYDVNKSKISLFPTDYDNRHKIVNTMLKKASRFIFGSYNSFNIAFYATDKYKINILGEGLVFYTSLIILAKGNMKAFYDQLTEGWDKFHSITFYGGRINDIYPPQLAKEKDTVWDMTNGERTITISPFDSYTREINVKINNLPAKFMISIGQYGKESDTGYNLCELRSFIRITFEDTQDFSKINEYYWLIKSIVALLVKQNNILLNVSLGQKGKDDRKFDTAECKIFDHYDNYSKRNSFNLIRIDKILDNIQKLIDHLENDKFKVIFSILPDNNDEVNTISVSDIQNICTVLENIYEWRKGKRIRDKKIKELKKRIKAVIEEFERRNDIDISDNTTIATEFRNLDFSLARKIMTIYSENKEIMDNLIANRKWAEFTEENVKKFVKLRNNITHPSQFEWDGSEKMYMPLFALVYIAFLREIDAEDVHNIIMNLF